MHVVYKMVFTTTHGVFWDLTTNLDMMHQLWFLHLYLPGVFSFVSARCLINTIQWNLRSMNCSWAVESVVVMCSCSCAVEFAAVHCTIKLCGWVCSCAGQIEALLHPPLRFTGFLGFAIMVLNFIVRCRSRWVSQVSTCLLTLQTFLSRWS